MMIGSVSWEEQLTAANPSGPLSTGGSGSQLLDSDGKQKQEVNNINELTLKQLLGRTPGVEFD